MYAQNKISKYMHDLNQEFHFQHEIIYYFIFMQQSYIIICGIPRGYSGPRPDNNIPKPWWTVMVWIIIDVIRWCPYHIQPSQETIRYWYAYFVCWIAYNPSSHSSDKYLPHKSFRNTNILLTDRECKNHGWCFFTFHPENE